MRPIVLKISRVMMMTGLCGLFLLAPLKALAKELYAEATNENISDIVKLIDDKDPAVAAMALRLITNIGPRAKGAGPLLDHLLNEYARYTEGAELLQDRLDLIIYALGRLGPIVEKARASEEEDEPVVVMRNLLEEYEPSRYEDNSGGYKIYWESLYALKKIQPEEATLYSSAGFKGIYIGMRREEIQNLVENTAWTYDQGKDNPSEVLRGDCTIEGSFLNRIGTEGTGEDEKPLSLQQVKLEYYDNQVVRFTILSPCFALGQMDKEYKDWGNFVVYGLKNKWGKPVKISQSPDKIDVKSFKKEKEEYPIEEWTLKNSEIEKVNGKDKVVDKVFGKISLTTSQMGKGYVWQLHYYKPDDVKKLEKVTPTQNPEF